MAIESPETDASRQAVLDPERKITVVEFLVRTLEEQGVRFIIGNPGTTELALVRACERPRKLQYAVVLSEVAAVPMADGFARSTRSLGVVNLHVAPGLGNGMGGLYTASVSQTPLLVLIGGQDRRFLHTNPILWGPVEQMAATVTKAVFNLSSRENAAFYIRRAVRLALTPPFGPVGLICPPDLMEEEIEDTPARVAPPVLGGLSAADASDYAIELTKARHPVLIAGEDVHWHHASAQVEELARVLSAPIYAAAYTPMLPVSSRSTHFAGYLPPSRKQIAERLARHDLLFFIGGTSVRTTLYSEGELSQPKLWIGDDGNVMSCEGEFTLSRIADTGAALTDILAALQAHDERPVSAVTTQRGLTEVPPASSVLHPSRAVRLLLQAFTDAIWVDESGLSTSDVREWMQLAAGEYLINGSGGIGWGLAASVGAALGNPTRQVVSLVGDGSALYASEALWTAEHYGTKLLVVVLANRRYATLNAAANKLTGQTLQSFSLEPPQFNFSGLASLYGWRYDRIASEPDLVAFLQKVGTRLQANTLVELELDPGSRPVTASRHF
jgi:benzoylformate decarboxylase